MEIVLQNVSKDFKEAVGLKNVFSSVNFTFRSGNVYLIRGRSGSGKSTLLSILGLLDSPTSGRVLIDGKDAASLTGGERKSFVSFHVGFLFQDNNVFNELTVLENLAIVSPDRARVEEETKRFGIFNLLAKKASSLSKGEVARLSLCRVLLEDKDVLLLDEPTGNLNAANATIIYDAIARIAKNRIVIVVSHDFSDDKSYPFVYLKMEDRALALSEAGAVVSSSAEASGHAPKPLRGRTCFRFAGILLKKTALRATIFSVATIAIILFSVLSIDFLSVDCNSFVTGRLLSSGLESVNVAGPSSTEGLFRGFTQTFRDSSSAVVPLYCVYSPSDSATLYGQKVAVEEGQISVPSFIASAYSLKVGDSLSVSTASTEIPLTVGAVIETGSEASISQLTSMLGSQEAAQALYYSSSPSLLSSQTVETIAAHSSYQLKKGSLPSLFAPFEESGDYFSEGELFMDEGGYSFDESHAAVLSGNQVNLIVGSSFAGTEFMDVYENKIFGKSFAVASVGSDVSGLGLSEVVASVEVKGLLIAEGMSSASISLQASEQTKAALLSSYFKLGLLSDKGEKGYVLTKDGYAGFDFLDNDVSYVGVFPSADVASLANKKILNSVIAALVAFLSAIVVFLFWFLVSGLHRSFKNERNLLMTIGYSKKDILKVYLLYFAMLLVPLILVSGVGVLIASPLVDSALLMVWKLVGSYDFFPFSPWSIVWLLGYAVAIPFLCSLIQLSVAKKELLDQIKLDKE
jgi:putative ABC transport system ATP-binding protein